MKTATSILFLIVITVFANAAPNPKAGESVDTKFKARYHRWVAAIYEHPGVLLMSSSQPYTNFPEFSEIVKLGPPALPAIAREIEANSDMALFLGEAIFQITGWKRSDFQSTSLQKQNQQLLKRLHDEKQLLQKS